MENEKDYLHVRLNGFLLNAGVVGLIRLLEYAKAEKGSAGDYYYEGQNFYISKDYILSHDLADLYVKTMVDRFGEGTRLTDIIKQRENVEKALGELQNGESNVKKAAEKKLKDFLETAVKYTEKASVKSGFAILAGENVLCPDDAMIKTFKAEKNIVQKTALYFDIVRLLEQPAVSETLKMKEIIYSKLNMFIGDASFLLRANAKKNIASCQREAFVIPLNKMAESKKEGKISCIDCGRASNERISISIMNDTTDDLARKKSYYWYQKPDAYLCPLCAFIYTLAPLGFAWLGNDAVFVNNNCDIDSLIGINSSIGARADEVSRDYSRFRLYNIFTGQELSALTARIDNLQVVIRSRKSDKYFLNIIGKDKVRILRDSAKYIDKLKTVAVKIGDGFINIYDETISNIVGNRSQYALINRLLKNALAENTGTFGLYDILTAQIISTGGNNVEDNKKLAYLVRMQGQDMRGILGEGVQAKDTDNKIRGFVYQLLNALSVDNREQFLNLIIRMYSSYGKPVPDTFLQCFGSDDAFKTFGYAYILGLKSEGKPSGAKAAV
jgi:CRISPR-associated protein Cst1